MKLPELKIEIVEYIPAWRRSALWAMAGLYIITGAVTIFDAQGAGGTSVASIARVLGSPLTAGIAMVAGGLAAVSAILFERHSRKWVISILLTPLAWLVWIAAIGPTFAIIGAHYADGVIRSRAFIFNDQAIYLAAALSYTYAMLDQSGLFYLTPEIAKWIKQRSH